MDKKEFSKYIKSYAISIESSTEMIPAVEADAESIKNMDPELSALMLKNVDSIRNIVAHIKKKTEA